MYTGQIQSTGPRYCPSMETKIVRFADKDRHQFFLEPEGRRTHEVYVNGLSTSLPRDVQDAMIRMIPGWSRPRSSATAMPSNTITSRPTSCNFRWRPSGWPGSTWPARSTARPATRRRPARACWPGRTPRWGCRARSRWSCGRDEAYLGVMIDDLVTRGVDEPYRMFTSRAEYRLLLRGDNADRRLTPCGNRLGLVGAERWQRFQAKARGNRTRGAIYRA